MTEEIIIDTDVPIPPKRKKWAKYLKVVEALEVGESFEVMGMLDRQNLYHLFEREGKKIRSRQIGKDKFRVWRVK